MRHEADEVGVPRQFGVVLGKICAPIAPRRPPSLALDDHQTAPPQRDRPRTSAHCARRDHRSVDVDITPFPRLHACVHPAVLPFTACSEHSACVPPSPHDLRVVGQPAHAQPRRDPIRFATFNASLNRSAPAELTRLICKRPRRRPTNDSAQLRRGARDRRDQRPRRAADQRVRHRRRRRHRRPVAMFAALAGYHYFFTAPSNTGVPAGFDLNNNGMVGGATTHRIRRVSRPVRHGRVLEVPDRPDAVRTFQPFLGRTCPAHCCRPTRRLESWYSPDELAVFPLSSKSHWDVPIDVGRQDVSTSSSVIRPHPCSMEPRTATAPATSTRSASGRTTSSRARRGTSTTTRAARWSWSRARRSSLPATRTPTRSTAIRCPGAIQQLLDHPRVNDRSLRAATGAVEATVLQGGANAAHIERPTVRHRRLRRHGTGKPECRLRAALEEPAHPRPRCSGRHRASPAQS